MTVGLNADDSHGAPLAPLDGCILSLWHLRHLWYGK